MGSPFTSPMFDAVLLKRFPSKRPLKTNENNAKANIMIKNNDLSLIFDNNAIIFPIKKFRLRKYNLTINNESSLVLIF